MRWTAHQRGWAEECSRAQRFRPQACTDARAHRGTHLGLKAGAVDMALLRLFFSRRQHLLVAPIRHRHRESIACGDGRKDGDEHGAPERHCFCTCSVYASACFVHVERSVGASQRRRAVSRGAAQSRRASVQSAIAAQSADAR